MAQDWICNSEEETAKAGIEILGNLKFPAIICLYGNLGSGKTVFCRSIIKYLLNDDAMIVPSPTYTIVQTYDSDEIWHFDLYRLDHPDDIYDIGWEDALTAKLCLIEWPERLGRLKPENSVDIVFSTLDNGARHISVKP